MRQNTICNFIEDLRAAKGLPVLPVAQLDAAGFAWDKVLAPIHEDFLASRDNESLFVEAARRGYSEAAQVWEMWGATTGTEQRLEAESEAAAVQEAAHAQTPAPVGPGRQALWAYLAERGVTEEKLAAMGRK